VGRRNVDNPRHLSVVQYVGRVCSLIGKTRHVPCTHTHTHHTHSLTHNHSNNLISPGAARVCMQPLLWASEPRWLQAGLYSVPDHTVTIRCHYHHYRHYY